MTDSELEKLIMSTNFYDEIERNLFLMAMAEDDQAMREEMDKEYKKPDWINIARGFQEAPEPIRAQAIKLYGEFCRFNPVREVQTFKELVELFTLAKITNKTGV